MENWWIVGLICLIVIIALIAYAIISSYLIVDGFVALFEPETYGLMIMGGVK